MARQALLRFLETAFRRWWIVAITVVAMAALAFASMSGRTQKFESTAVLRADDQTILADLAEDTSNDFAFDTPSEIASSQINESMRTNEFVNDVLERAGISLGVVPGLLQRGDVRVAVHAFADGDNPMKVRASTTNPEASQRLVQSTIDAYVASVIDATITESIAAQEYYSDRLVTYTADRDAANEALSTYLAEHPEPVTGDRPTEEAIEVDRLSGAVRQAEERYSKAQASIEEAELAIERTRADVRQRLRVVDAAEDAGAPVSTRRDDIMTIGLYTALGIALSLMAIGLLTFLDRSLHDPEEVRARLGVEVLTTVPEVGPPRRAGKAKPPAPPQAVPEPTA